VTAARGTPPATDITVVLLTWLLHLPLFCCCVLALPIWQACYSAICTLSMPSWVLHGSITDAKGFLRMFILGSGILIGYWCRYGAAAASSPYLLWQSAAETKPLHTHTCAAAAYVNEANMPPTDTLVRAAALQQQSKQRHSIRACKAVHACNAFVTHIHVRRTVATMPPADYMRSHPPATLLYLQVPYPHLLRNCAMAYPTTVPVSGLAPHRADLRCC
jgi:hypothetical protein